MLLKTLTTGKESLRNIRYAFVIGFSSASVIRVTVADFSSVLRSTIKVCPAVQVNDLRMLPSSTILSEKLKQLMWLTFSKDLNDLCLLGLLWKKYHFLMIHSLPQA